MQRRQRWGWYLAVLLVTANILAFPSLRIPVRKKEEKQLVGSLTDNVGKWHFHDFANTTTRLAAVGTNFFAFNESREGLLDIRFMQKFTIQQKFRIRVAGARPLALYSNGSLPGIAYYLNGNVTMEEPNRKWTFQVPTSPEFSAAMAVGQERTLAFLAKNILGIAQLSNKSVQYFHLPPFDGSVVGMDIVTGMDISPNLGIEIHSRNGTNFTKTILKIDGSPNDSVFHTPASSMDHVAQLSNLSISDTSTPCPLKSDITTSCPSPSGTPSPSTYPLASGTPASHHPTVQHINTPQPVNGPVPLVNSSSDNTTITTIPYVSRDLGNGSILVKSHGLFEEISIRQRFSFGQFTYTVTDNDSSLSFSTTARLRPVVLGDDILFIDSPASAGFLVGGLDMRLWMVLVRTDANQVIPLPWDPKFQYLFERADVFLDAILERPHFALLMFEDLESNDELLLHLELTGKQLSYWKEMKPKEDDPLAFLDYLGYAYWFPLPVIGWLLDLHARRKTKVERYPLSEKYFRF